MNAFFASGRAARAGLAASRPEIPSAVLPRVGSVASGQPGCTAARLFQPELGHCARWNLVARFPWISVVLLAVAALQGALAPRPQGIDVPHWQGTDINWTNVKNSGIAFAWCKASEGTGYTDNTFALNQTNAVAAGVLVGAYHFARYDLNLGTGGADAEAAYFWSVARNYIKGTATYLMPMLDVEHAPGTNYNRTKLSQWVNEWCSNVVSLAAASNVTVTPVIYSSSSFAGTWFNSSVTQWIPWIANWNGRDPQTNGPSPTAPWPTWTVWQYTDAVAVPGAGTVDGDVFNGTFNQLVATLVVGGDPPIITNQPASQTVVAGIDATFAVGASAALPLSYQWRFNGANLSGATNSSYTRLDAQPVDAGLYSVVVSDELGRATSSNVVLTVLVPALITSQPQDRMVSVGQNATFTVGFAGTAPVSCQWLFNGKALPGATASSYAVSLAQSANVGVYSVIVSNIAGVEVSSNAALVLAQSAALGDNTFGQGSALIGSTNLIAVAAGGWHNLGLRADGTVVAWGDNTSGQGDVPAELHDALAVAAGGYHSLAIRADQTVVAWGANDSGQKDVPAGLAGVIGISAGTWHSVALRADGSVVAWGDNTFGQTNLPPGLGGVTAIAAGGNHTLALKANGTVVAWGENTGAEGYVTGQSAVPWGLSNVVAIGAGTYHSLAVKHDGTVVTWGDDSQGQCSLPPGLSNVVAVVGGSEHSVALKADGAVKAWGAGWNGQCDLSPALAPASGITAGEYHTVVLLADSLPVPQLLHPALKRPSFNALIQTLYRRHYALECSDSLAAGNWTGICTNSGNGALRVLADPSATASRRFYRLRQW